LIFAVQITKPRSLLLRLLAAIGEARILGGTPALRSNGTSINVSALAREHGVSRATIRRRLERGWTPASRPPPSIETPPSAPVPGQSAAKERPVATTMWPGVVTVLVAIGIAFLAIIINGQADWRLGGTPLASVTFAGMAVAADLLAITLPTAAVSLWHVKRPGVAGLAWLTWTLAATLTTLSSVGYVELHTSDTAVGGRAVVVTSAAVTDQRAAGVATAQLAASAARKAREAECEIRGPRCRERETDERAALTGLAAAIAVPIPAAATIADADPQITAALRLVRWAGLKLTTDDVVNLRLALMAILPNIAGLVLAFGTALRGR
jgi:hypothetical protein